MVTGSYKMNSSPRSESDPYYECPMGETVTPTVVSNFNLPNSNVNKDGPYLKILEQPQTKFRFRYKSEMVGTHGQLKAESSDKNKNVFPTVQLCNWKGGPALIRLMLYTAEDNANDRKRHVHELNGKNCNKEGFTGGCEVVVDEEDNYTAQFPNLGIIHIAKRDVQNIIFQRKREELINYTCMNNPGLRTESIQHNIPPTKLQKMKEEAEEEARNMDLNKVVLRFQTFFFDTKSNCYRPITDYVDSEVIFNLKNASTGELKIVRISAVSSPCAGGTEVWMLVEKVKKNNVRIKFYELDKDNREVWKAYGEFKESDVHHQYAIVFRTPPYRYTNVREPVHVKIQLERTTDNDTSEPLDFTYVPENLKRSNAYLDSKVDLDVNPQKRIRCNNDMDAIDLKTRGNLFLGSGELKHPYSSEAPYQSPPHMVPSPITPADSPSSQGFYSPPHQGISHNPSIAISDTGEDFAIFAANSEDSMRIPLENSFSQHQMGNLQHVNPQYQVLFGSEGQNGHIPITLDGDPTAYFQSSIYSTHQMLSPYHQVPSPSSNEQNSPLGGQMSPFNQGGVSPGHSVSPVFDQNMPPVESDSALAQIQQFDAVQKQVIYSKTKVKSPQQWDFSDLVKSPVDHINQSEEIDLLDLVSDSKFFAAPKDLGDIQADSFSFHANKVPSKVATTVKREAKDIDTLTDKLSQVSVSEAVKEGKQKNPGKSELGDSVGSKDLAFRVAVTAADCLQSYAATGDVTLLLATHRYLLAVQNNQGDNSLHTAVLNKNKDAFNKILKASTDLFCCDLLSAQNYAGETPVHLAVRGDEVEMLKILLLTPGCNVNILDAEGNTALHLAAIKPYHHSLAAILSRPVNGKENPTSKIINLYNYQGQTPLHLAVISGCFESVKLLLNCGALIHMCERKQGANSLHLSAMFGHHDIAKYLIENTSITVDAGLFDGNAALHIATQAKDEKMCAILMAGKANPYAKNSLQKSTKNPEGEEEKEDSSSEDDTEEEQEEGGFTPVDYAEDNPEILSILLGSRAESLKSEDSTKVLEFVTQKTEQSRSNVIDAVIDVSAQV